MLIPIMIKLALVGGIAAWILYDDYRLKRSEDKVIIPAYVLSTYSVKGKWYLVGDRTPVAQFIYYDYKALRFRILSTLMSRTN